MFSPRIYDIYTGPDQYVVYDRGSTDREKPLVIDRTTQELSISNYDISHFESAFGRPDAVYGIIGTVRLLSGRHLMTIDKCELVGHIFGHRIFKVTGASIRPFSKSRQHLGPIETEAEETYISMLSFVLQMDGFYFSNTYDLTVSQQRLADFGPESKNLSQFQRADPQFLWNKIHLDDWSNLLNAAASGGSTLFVGNYLTPIMLGFVGILKASSSLECQGVATSYTLISRRSVKRAGTRFYARGLDADGNAANYVETEQIFYLAGGHIYSFVQIRGSVPLLWSQRPTLQYKPRVKMGTLAASAVDESSPVVLNQDQREMIKRHFHDACYLQRYGKSIAINLLDQKGMESRLCRSYGLAAQFVDAQELRLESFDFHRECRALKWHRLSILMDRIEVDLVAMGQFKLHSPSGKETLEGATLRGRQNGVFRTNCIDCLDRTNVVQSMIGRRVVDEALRDAGVVSSGAAEAECRCFLAEAWPAFEGAFKGVWADNADTCSVQYSGTPALKTDYTRTGKRTFIGVCMDGYHSIVRYYLNNFADGFRQDAVNLFLGHYSIFGEANGQPKLPLPKPRPFQSDAVKVLTQFMPMFFAFATSMSVLCLIYPSEDFGERMVYSFLWGAASVLSALAIYVYGEDYVNRPRFPMD